MERRCEYCGHRYSSSASECPHCGTPDMKQLEKRKEAPKTIDELRAYCESRKINTEHLRFFIGQDYQEPKAYGIFKDDAGCVVVYKNHSDGERTISYRGSDEKAAVYVIFAKLRRAIFQRSKHKTDYGSHHGSEHGSEHKTEHKSSSLHVYGASDHEVSSRKKQKKLDNLKKAAKYVVTALLALALIASLILAYRYSTKDNDFATKRIDIENNPYVLVFRMNRLE